MPGLWHMPSNCSPVTPDAYGKASHGIWDKLSTKQALIAGTQGRSLAALRSSLRNRAQLLRKPKKSRRTPEINTAAFLGHDLVGIGISKAPEGSGNWETVKPYWELENRTGFWKRVGRLMNFICCFIWYKGRSDDVHYMEQYQQEGKDMLKKYAPHRKPCGDRKRPSQQGDIEYGRHLNKYSTPAALCS